MKKVETGKIKRINKYLIFLTAAVMMIFGSCMTIHANPSSSQVNTLYKKFLSQSSTKVVTAQNYWSYSLKDVYFRAFDVDKDGVNELIVKKNTYAGAKKFFYIYIYGIKNNKVNLILIISGYDQSGAAKDEFYYISKYKAIPDTGDNYGSLCTIKNGATCRLIDLYKSSSSYYVDEKQVTAQTYNSTYKKYFSRNLFKTYKLYKNTAANRAKYLKSTTVKLNAVSKSLYVGQSYKLKVSGTTKKVKWTTSNSSIASIKNGKVTAKKAGTATITASVAGKKLKCKITVKKPQPSLSLSKTSVTLSLAGARSCQINVTKKNTTKSVKWKSRNTTIAKVSDGLITAKGVGTTAIDVTCGKITKTCYVTVKDTATKTITIKAKTFEDWCKEVNTQERNLTFGSGLAIQADGKTRHTGNIIVKREVLQYRKIAYKVSINTPGYYKTCYLNIPCKIRYTLHRHNLSNNVNSSNVGQLIVGLIEQKFVWTQYCSCGFSCKLEWEIPLDTPEKLTAGETYNITTTSLNLD